MDVVRKEVRALIDKEHDEALRNHGMFASHHEKHSVMQEELEETMDEVEQLKKEFACMWNAVKHDQYENAESFANRIKYTAEHLAIEAIQVAAMAKKQVKKKGA